MSIIEAIILGLVQGLTEFLPVSSSGHLEIVKNILNINLTDNATFSLLVHFATVLSIIIVFREEIKKILKGGIGDNKEERKFLLNIIIASVPVIVAGLLYKEKLESLFNKNLELVGIGLLITSVLLTFAHYKKSKKLNLTKTSALLIGIAQLFAVVPGISRSGATISTALLLNVKKEEAARFSFFILIIPVIGASILKIFEIINNGSSIGLIPGLVGFLVALIAGVIACSATVSFIKNRKLIYFSAYCAIIGISVILAA